MYTILKFYVEVELFIISVEELFNISKAMTSKIKLEVGISIID